jgi:hypothetical protein
MASQRVSRRPLYIRSYKQITYKTRKPSNNRAVSPRIPVARGSNYGRDAVCPKLLPKRQESYDVL